MSDFTIDEYGLPTPCAGRWTHRRKAKLIMMINTGVVTAELACLRYHISPEEMVSWIKNFSAPGGADNLRIKQIQNMRRQQNRGR
jgi:Protein of unknown function (DUF1153)